MTKTDPNKLILDDMGLSGISWTDYPWNPWLGCTKVAPECIHCYLGREENYKHPDPDTGQPRKWFGGPWLSDTWGKPFRLQEKAAGMNCALRIFTCSHSDFFHEWTDDYRDMAWLTMKQTPNLCYLVLTKRPERVADHLPSDWGAGYPNVWLGTSTGCRATLKKMDILRKVPAALKFVSCEPLLEDISGSINLDGFKWLIAGGESGFGIEYRWDPKRPGDTRGIKGGRRTMDLKWAQALMAKCAAENVVFYFKQITAPKSGQGITALDGKIHHDLPPAPFGLPWAVKKR